MTSAVTPSRYPPCVPTVKPRRAKEASIATTALPDTQTCAFPGETPTLAGDVEADLRGRVVSCEAALANLL